MTLTITGNDLYDSLTAGYLQLRAHMQEINNINVFPVADGDTGSNITHTMRSILSNTRKTASVAEMSDNIAKSALIGARGNSGMIIAQFFQGFYMVAKDFEELTMKTFITAVKSAVDYAYTAVEHPVDGTILTVMSKWAQSLAFSQDDNRLPIPIHLRRGLRAARQAEIATTDQMELLRRNGVVDAGAKAFVVMLNGVDSFIRNTTPMADAELFSSQMAIPLEEAADHTVEAITFRYCTEALMNNMTVEKKVLHDEIVGFGDSLVLGGHGDMMRIHIHTDDPARLFEHLSHFGEIAQQKVDDMVMQQLAANSPVAKTAIVTDSSADIPIEVRDALRIYTIPQILQVDETSYFDRITIATPSLLDILDSPEAKVSSSMPSVGEIQRHLEFLTQHYQEVLVLSVAAKLSGTFRTYQLAAKELQEQGARITILDTRLNASAQGLVVAEAAKAAAAGKSMEEIVAHVEQVIDRTSIMVSVQSIDMMVRSGRIPQKLGKFVKKINFKPLIGLAKDGNGKILGVRVSRAGSISLLVSRFMKAYRKQGIEAYGMSYIGTPELADSVAKILIHKTGIRPQFIEQASPVIALHAGRGSISLSITTKAS
jgi:hypothetical protein